jgi:membrane-associated phospholipid phosphatase
MNRGQPLSLDRLLAAAAVGGVAATAGVYAISKSEGAFTNVDLPLAQWCKDHVSGEMLRGMRIVTQFGSTVVVVGAAAAVTALERRGGRSSGVVKYLLAAVGGQVVITNVAKFVFQRERPRLLQLVATSSSSFPSGHSLAAAASWASFACILSLGRNSATKVCLFTFAGSIAVAVAMSRVALGVHWSTDVVAGLLLGWSWAATVALLLRRQLGAGATTSKDFGLH